MDNQDLKIKALIVYKTFFNGWLNSPTKDDVFKNGVSLGLIPKADLIDGHKYYGRCRHSDTAVWSSEKGRFVYQRTKMFSVFDEEIAHPEDDEGYDIFAPVKDITDEPGV